jgi:hypothetical protein
MGICQVEGFEKGKELEHVIMLGKACGLVLNPKLSE